MSTTSRLSQSGRVHVEVTALVLACITFTPMSRAGPGSMAMPAPVPPTMRTPCTRVRSPPSTVSTGSPPVSVTTAPALAARLTSEGNTNGPVYVPAGRMTQSPGEASRSVSESELEGMATRSQTSPWGRTV